MSITGSGAFVSDISFVPGSVAIVLLDVVTTGATLEACGHELLKVEGLRLSIATFAYTIL